MSARRGRLPGASVTRRRSAPYARHDSDQPAEQAEHDALEEQLAGDPPRARAQRGANRELLLARFGSDEEQVGDVRARDEKHHADRSHQHPEHGAHVADEVVFQRADVRREARLLEQLQAGAWKRREAGEGDRESDVRHRRWPERSSRPA